MSSSCLRNVSAGSTGPSPVVRPRLRGVGISSGRPLGAAPTPNLSLATAFRRHSSAADAATSLVLRVICCAPDAAGHRSKVMPS